MPNIYPTKSCFDDAVEIFTEILKRHPRAILTDEFVLVHGIVAPYGKDFAHAWVESTREGQVLFIGLLDEKRQMFAAPTMDFYMDVKMKEVTRYTPREAYDAEKQAGASGPWVARYRDLCRDSNKREGEPQ